DNCLSGEILRMGFARENKLYRSFPIGQYPNQPFRIVQQQIRPLISRETAREAQCQPVLIENLAGLVDLPLRRAPRGPLEAHLSPPIPHQPLPPPPTQLPQFFVAARPDLVDTTLVSPPAILSATSGPQLIGFGRVPGWDVDAVRHVPDRNLNFRPS